MSYTTPLEIQSDFKNLVLGADKNVTEDDVFQFIKEADALINAYIAARYTVPISPGVDPLNLPDSFQLMKTLSRAIVAERIRGILEVKNAGDRGANQNVRSGMSLADALKILKDLKSGDLDLVGLDLIYDTSFYTYPSEESCVVFHKCEKEW